MVDPIASARALQIPAYAGLPDQSREDVAEFNGRAELLHERLAADRAAGGLGRDKLLGEIANMWSEREAIAEKMAGELAVVLDEAEAVMKRVGSDTRERFATVGITADGMPAAGSNYPEAAERQFVYLLRFDPKYRHASDELVDAETQHRGANSQIAHCQRKVAQIDELRQAKPTKPTAGVF